MSSEFEFFKETNSQNAMFYENLKSLKSLKKQYPEQHAYIKSKWGIFDDLVFTDGKFSSMGFKFYVKHEGNKRRTSYWVSISKESGNISTEKHYLHRNTMIDIFKYLRGISSEILTPEQYEAMEFERQMKVIGSALGQFPK